MHKLITSLATLAVLGAGLTGCSNNDNFGKNLPPFQPPSTTTSAPAAQYTQIERLSRPAIKEVFERFVDHQASNASEPYADATLSSSIVATEDLVRPPNKALNTDYGAALASVLYPDEYTVNLNGSSPASTNADPEFFLSEVADGPTYFGGRAPNDDVIGLELPVLFGHLLPALKVQNEDNEENDCLSAQNLGATKVPTTSTFPYLAQAH